MAYNYGGPPGAYGGQQQPYGGAPGMGGPPTGPAQGFQPPPNLPPGMNFNAPVIRLGMDGGGGGRPPPGNDRGDRGGRGSNAEPMGGRDRRGLGADRNLDRERQAVRDSMMALQPPTREEVSRTIFVGGLSEGMPNDEALENILRCAGKLRRWTRARDADEKKCKFGFAEYEDVESLEAAAELYPDLELPLFNADGSVQKEKNEEGEEGEVKKQKWLVVIDDASKEYIETWMARKKEDENTRQFRMESCKTDLDQTIAGLINQAAHATNGVNGHGDLDGDVAMADTNGDANGAVEHITIQATGAEDELADIPVEQRATVAEEIKAFRDRSNRRDIERLRREEDLEQEERRRNGPAPRANRLATPPPAAANSTNGIPLGPRGQQGPAGAPSGPKGFRGTQIPNDYVNGVAFVPGAGPDGRGMTVSLNREEEDAEESDEELERRRQERKDAEIDKQYQDQVRRWHNRERTRGAAQERERKREDDEKRAIEKAREDILAKFASWNDDEEAEKARHPYYRDRSAWLRIRDQDRERERREDDADRKAEEREKAEEQRRNNEAQGMANDFLDSMNIEPEPEKVDQAGPAPFKISLGGASKTKPPTGTAPKRAQMDVEGLLEDEEDAAASGLKRDLQLKPLEDMSTLPTSGLGLTDDEKASARQQLASEIPTDNEKLFAHPIKYDDLTSEILNHQIRPFVEKKVVEYLGVQEDLIVDAVLAGVREKSSAQSIKEELEGPLEDEAEVLVKKVWRLLVFWGECESRGLQ